MSEPTLEQLSDPELVARARQETDSGADGGGDAFRALFLRWKDETFGFLVGVLRDRALAEDVQWMDWVKSRSPETTPAELATLKWISGFRTRGVRSSRLLGSNGSRLTGSRISRTAC